MRGSGRISVFLAGAILLMGAEKKRMSPLDAYLESVLAGGGSGGETPSAGSLYVEQGPLGNIARDLRARYVNDLVTILVVDRASAISKGATNATRKSSAAYQIKSLAGPVASKRLSDLARLSGERELQGAGETTRENALTTSLAARVTHVLPNGDLVVEGFKEIAVNDERQLVRIRGIVRPVDLSVANTVRSDRLAFLEVSVNGRGVVGDVVKRPFFLYRLLMGVLPF